MKNKLKAAKLLLLWVLLITEPFFSCNYNY
jgi:hypothetical protein